jgi:hypothetical protein
MLLKTGVKTHNAIDPNRVREHSDEGSKRFEEQQASGNVASRER